MSNQPTSTGTARSRVNAARPATRKQAKARLCLVGPTGSGKTWTSLGIATELCPDGQRIVLIDTEPSDPGQTAGELYADRFEFEVIPWDPPYSPVDLALTVRELGRDPGVGVIIVDSLSAFWNGDGGTLDQVDRKFSGWKEATPMQWDMVAALTRVDKHVIVATRVKMEYAISEETDNQGRKKQKVERVGLAPVQRGDLEYEFQVVGMLDGAHEITVTKSRAEPLASKVFRANHQSDFARAYAEWLNGGMILAPQRDVDRVRDRVRSITDPARRAEISRSYKATFGSPDQLLAERVDEVTRWLDEQRVPGAVPPPATGAAQIATPAEAHDDEDEERGRYGDVTYQDSPEAAHADPAARSDDDPLPESPYVPVIVATEHDDETIKALACSILWDACMHDVVALDAAGRRRACKNYEIDPKSDIYTKQLAEAFYNDEAYIPQADPPPTLGDLMALLEAAAVPA